MACMRHSYLHLAEVSNAEGAIPAHCHQAPVLFLWRRKDSQWALVTRDDAAPCLARSRQVCSLGVLATWYAKSAMKSVCWLKQAEASEACLGSHSLMHPSSSPEATRLSATGSRALMAAGCASGCHLFTLQVATSIAFIILHTHQLLLIERGFFLVHSVPRN